jgi:osmotically-inducible protein OsmY
LVTLVVLTISLVVSAFLFKDSIIKNFIEAANQNLNTPVKIGKLDVSVFEKFPQLSIVLTDVTVEDSHEGQYPLLTASRISFQLNPLEVYSGTYKIKGLEITDSETNLRINEAGVNNYTILKQSSGQRKNDSLVFELKNVRLTNTLVRYVDFKRDEDLIFSSEKLDASIHSSNDVYTIEASGELTTKKIKIEKTSLLEEKSFIIKADLIYNDAERLLEIEPSTLLLKKSKFAVKGSYQWKTTAAINIAVDGKDSDIQTLLSLLPEAAARKFEKYESKGNAYFSATLKGNISAKKNPALSVEFGLTDAVIFHPDSKARITDASVEGSFASSDVSDLRAASLVLKNIHGTLNADTFKSNLIIHNLIDPEVIFNFKGALDAPALVGLYPVKEIENLSGKLVTDISFEGQLAWLKSRATAQKANTNGSIQLHNINFLYAPGKLDVKNLNGLLQFNNNDLAMSNVSVQAGNSDFLFNGFFKNIITFLLFENQPIGIEADLKSGFLDLDELFRVGYGTSNSKTTEYNFAIPANVHLNFNCDVQSLRYQRFNARKLKGDLLVKNEVAVSRGITLKTMGGDLSLTGIVDAKNHKAIDVMTTAKLNGIHLDSVFYVFNNFRQTFIEDKHLKGKATADVNLEMTLNEKLKLFQETLIADISTVIKNGELNNFEPMQKLNRYLDDEGLSKLRFADLKNDIHIENKTIYIPQMEVRSNVTTIQISGTHTFDQRIDYRIVSPLRNKNKINIEEAGGAIEDQGGQLKVFLKITGTTDNYRVQYDGEAMKQKIVSNMKKEVQELKEAFKTKGKQKKKELELSTEEFDWDNP